MIEPVNSGTRVPGSTYTLKCIDCPDTFECKGLQAKRCPKCARKKITEQNSESWRRRHPPLSPEERRRRQSLGAQRKRAQAGIRAHNQDSKPYMGRVVNSSDIMQSLYGVTDRLINDILSGKVGLAK